MLELWGPRSNRVSELSRAFQCGLLVRTMPYRTTFDPARGGQTEPASTIRCVDEILRIRRPDRADGVAVSVCQLCLFRSAQIHYVNPPGTSLFATEREPILRLAKSQDSGRSTSGHSLSFITSETRSTSYSRKRPSRLELNAIRWSGKKAASHMIQKESAIWRSPMVPATDAPICRFHKLFRPFTSRMKASNLPSGDATGGSASAASTICAIRGIWWRGTSKAHHG